MKALRKERARSESPAMLGSHSPVGATPDIHSELASYLTEFSEQGVPTLRGFEVAQIPDESVAYLLWATKLKNIKDLFDWKSLTQDETSRQAVICELIHTEAEYIKHLMAIVEVFIAAAHAIQDRGKMLGIQTSALFSNLPDLLNASLQFWDISIIPMVKDAVEHRMPFRTDLMAYGFDCFKDIFLPYEKFVVDQSKLLEYYRNHQNDVEFSMYLAWCHSQKECNRLQLNDFLVKPMQRLTKYSLILLRIIDHTQAESERTLLEDMEQCAKSYVIELNRTVRQHEEIEKVYNLEKVIEPHEVEMKDEEADKLFKSYALLNLRAPMLYCLPTHSRSLIHQADLRFRDSAKEIDVRVFLLTDMLLVCRRLTKGNQFKLIRPKYMIDKMIQTTRLDKHNREVTGLAYVLIDDVGSSYASFVLSETAKDPNPHQTLKTLENKIKEAKLTYELLVWVARNPNREITRQDVNITAELTNTKARLSCDEGIIEHEAREHVTAVVHRSMGASTDRNVSLLSLTTSSMEGSSSIYHQVVVGISARASVVGKRYNIVHRTSSVVSSGSTPRNSRLSSFQHSTSAQSHDESQTGPSRLLHRASTSVEHHLPPVIDVNEGSPSITTSDSETVSTAHTHTSTLKSDVPRISDPIERSSSAQSTLRIQSSQNNVATLIYSLPDLTIEPSTPRTVPSPTQPTASERMYQSHQEILQRNRLIASQNQQYLSPDHRGSSYPPPSPTRASLKRGFAFSYSTKNPPLSKMGHVSSQSQVHIDTTTTSSGKDEKGSSPKPVRSPDKKEKKSKSSSSRSRPKDEKEKSGTRLRFKDESPAPTREENINYLYKREESSSSSIYKEGSPGASIRDISPGASWKAVSPSVSLRDESTGLSFRDQSKCCNQRDESPGISYKSESTSINVYEGPTPVEKGYEHLASPSVQETHISLVQQGSSLQIQSATPILSAGEAVSHTSRHEINLADDTNESNRQEESNSNQDVTSLKSFNKQDDPQEKQNLFKKQDAILMGDQDLETQELRDNSNKDDRDEFNQKTASSVICKKNKDVKCIDNTKKYICLECEQRCEKYVDQHNDEKNVYSSSSTSNSKATDLVSSLMCEIIISAPSSVNGQGEKVGNDSEGETVKKSGNQDTAYSDISYEEKMCENENENENDTKQNIKCEKPVEQQIEETLVNLNPVVLIEPGVETKIQTKEGSSHESNELTSSSSDEKVF